MIFHNSGWSEEKKDTESLQGKRVTVKEKALGCTAVCGCVDECGNLRTEKTSYGKVRTDRDRKEKGRYTRKVHLPMTHGIKSSRTFHPAESATYLLYLLRRNLWISFSKLHPKVLPCGPLLFLWKTLSDRPYPARSASHGSSSDCPSTDFAGEVRRLLSPLLQRGA